MQAIGGVSGSIYRVLPKSMTSVSVAQSPRKELTTPKRWDIKRKNGLQGTITLARSSALEIQPPTRQPEMSQPGQDDSRPPG